jgi:hypothetical protein
MYAPTTRRSVVQITFNGGSEMGSIMHITDKELALESEVRDLKSKLHDLQSMVDAARGILAREFTFTIELPDNEHSSNAM